MSWMSNKSDQIPMTSAREILLGGMLAAAVMALASSARAKIQTTGTPGSRSVTKKGNG
jgi:hypothetical protein